MIMVLVILPTKYRKVFYNKIFNDRVNVDFTNKYDNILQVIKKIICLLHITPSLA